MPASELLNRRITLTIPQLVASVPTEITGTISQGKPRLRKDSPKDRSKLHLVPLVMAIARLPDPAREDKTHVASLPLENKGFLISHMVFQVVSRDATAAVLTPLSAKVLHTDITIDLTQRFKNIADDIKELSRFEESNKQLAGAIQDHYNAVRMQQNDIAIRRSADEVISLQAEAFGNSNTASMTTIVSLPPTTLEDDIEGKEGRILTRLHSYRERDRSLVKNAKALFIKKNGRLYCECCGFVPEQFYGERGQDRIQAHHRRPVEELLPDSITTPEDLAMVCPNCHDIIHAKRPWITVEEVQQELRQRGSHHAT
ncbi:MAG: HNH endonuclease [Nitrososphaera sp.]|nr:HNH endonuclease [Nitrososphaera sp.]